MYYAEPDPALGGRTAYWPRGKVLGGSSSINAMVHVRGQPGDFDDWRDAGNPGWGWSDVLPYFRKSEDHVWGASQYHGAGGEMHVSDFAGRVHPLCGSFIRTGQALGWRHTRDFNGADHEGVGLWQMAIRDGRRVSASSAFLRPAMKRSNLRVLTRAHATRVLFDGQRAAGVECRVGGEAQSFKARREVVLACGAALLETMVIVAVALFFSSLVVTPALAGMFTAATFVAGRSSGSSLGQGHWSVGHAAAFSGVRPASSPRSSAA
jgi:choline dehydrogenase